MDNDDWKNSLREKLFRQITGTTREKLRREIPPVRASLDYLWEAAKSKQPLTVLGRSADSIITIAREQRESNFHVLGGIGEGKSKFIEVLLRDDIGKYPCVLLDPSVRADTMYRVLKYCAHIGYEKVCIIEPNDIWKYGHVPAFNPLRVIYDRDTKQPNLYFAPAVISGIMDSIRVLWQQTHFSQTSFIQRYLPAVLTALYAAELTFAEVSYFFDQNHFRGVVQSILNYLPVDSTPRVRLENAFRLVTNFKEFVSTVGRINPFDNPTLKLILGSRKHTIDFRKLIRENYVTLVNLDPTDLYDQEHQQLLGTLVINEFIVAQERLNKSYTGKKNIDYIKPLFVYIDEIGDYATRRIANVLDKKRKSGIRFCLAHQGFNQIEDQYVLNAINRGCSSKVLFNTSSHSDRSKMVREMYGGNLNLEKVDYALTDMQSGEAVIKVHKRPPALTYIERIETPEVDADTLASFKNYIYNTHDWYRSPSEVTKETQIRFKRIVQGNRQSTGGATSSESTANTESVEPGAPHDSPSASSADDRTTRLRELAAHLSKQAGEEVREGLSGKNKDAGKNARKGLNKKVSKGRKRPAPDK